MAYGGVYFELFASGSTATSAATAHSLFGANGGLSLLNHQDVVFIQIVPTGADARVWNSTVTNGTGLRLSDAGSVFDLPPMRVGSASTLHFTRDAGANTTLYWTVWTQWPGTNK